MEKTRPTLFWSLTCRSKYDLRDWVVWAMYEGRHQEHLSTSEVHQAESFLAEIQIKISLEIYGEADKDSRHRQPDNSVLQELSDRERRLYELPKPKQRECRVKYFTLLMISFN